MSQHKAISMETPQTIRAKEVCLGPVSEFPEGTRRMVKLGSISIGVFNVEGRFLALRNYCPHEGAELCLGKVTGTNEPTDRCADYQWGRDGTILRCPWHGWEFDMTTGESLFDPVLRIKTYAVSTRNGVLWLHERMK